MYPRKTFLGFSEDTSNIYIKTKSMETVKALWLEDID